jgi:hypothetical protein
VPRPSHLLYRNRSGNPQSSTGAVLLCRMSWCLVQEWLWRLPSCSVLFPALQMSKPEISEILQSSNKKTIGNARARRLHGALISAQIGLTLLLLTAAGTVIENFVHLLRVPLGYEPHGVVSVAIPLHENTYASWLSRVEYFGSLCNSIRTLPDVVSASVAANATPPHSGWRLLFEMLGKPVASPKTQMANVNLVDSDYFRTLETPLLQGRIWNSTEVADGSQLSWSIVLLCGGAGSSIRCQRCKRCPSSRLD